MPDTLPTPVCPALHGAARRYRDRLLGGLAEPEARAELVAYLVVLRPGLPRVLAVELAEAIAAGTARAGGAERARERQGA